MSHWTKVHGVIEVDTFSRSSAEAMYLAQTVVNHLPRVTGSEGDVEYYLNLVHGSNTSSNCDEFDQRSNLCNGAHFRVFEYQSCVLITIDGYLRDREFDQTLRETVKALARLSSRLWVKRCVVSVSDWVRRFVFDDPHWVIAREQTSWARDLLWEFERS